MADRIKGITIVIGVDTNGLITLDKALKPINSSISTTGKYLKDVNKLMKFNPSSFTLLGQKQGYLQQQITDTKARIDNLKAAQMAMDEKMKAGLDVNQEEYKALQREIIETEGKLKQLNREFRRGGGDNKIAQRFVAMGTAIKEAGDKLKDFGKQLTSVGRELAPISGALTAVGVGSLKLNKKWDTAFDNMIYKSGKTGESAQELRDLLKKMYAGSAFELTDISDTIGQVSARFKGLENTQIEKMSDSLLKFQKITGTDAKKSVDDLGKVLSAFKIPAKEYEKVLDGLVTVQTETGADIENLIKTMKNYGAPLRTLFGNDIKMSIGFLGSLDKAGVNSTKVMMSLQKALTAELKEMTPEKAKKAMEDMFKSLKSGATSVDEMKKALELMGSRGGLALVDAFTNAGLSWDDLVKVIESGGSTVDGVFGETYNAEEKNRQKLHEMEVAAVDFAASVADVVTPALEKASEKVGWLKEKWDNLDKSQQSNILKFGGILAIGAPALIIIGKSIEALGTIVSFLGTIFKWAGQIAGSGGFGAVLLTLGSVYFSLKYLIVPAIQKMHEWLDKINRPNNSSRKAFEENETKKREAAKLTNAEMAEYYRQEAERSSGQQRLYAQERAKHYEKLNGLKQDYSEQSKTYAEMVKKLMLGFGASSKEADNAANTIKNNFNKASSGMVGAGLSAGVNWKSGLNQSGVVNAASARANEIRGKLRNIGSGAYTWGRDAGTGFASGLQSARARLIEAANNMANIIRQRMHFSKPDIGPLADADTYMPDFINLLTEGINRNKYKLLGAVSGLAQDVKTDLGLNPDVTNTLTNNTVFQPVNNFAITIGNREIKDYAVEAVTSSISNKMKAQNMNRGLL